MSRRNPMMAWALALGLTLGLVGCSQESQEGSLEEAGQEATEAIETAGEAVEDAGEAAGEAVEEAGEAVEAAADSAM
ncbi:MAG TPA: hypothetical protein VIE68_08905 [Gemmatimonadota bacterium]